MLSQITYELYYKILFSITQMHEDSLLYFVYLFMFAKFFSCLNIKSFSSQLCFLKSFSYTISESPFLFWNQEILQTHGNLWKLMYKFLKISGQELYP